jgi:hypothetical protein
VKSLTAQQAATLGALPSAIFPLIGRGQPAVVGKLRATSTWTRRAVESLVDESFCHDVTGRELERGVSRALKPGRAIRGA